MDFVFHILGNSDFQIILTASLVSSICGLLGCFLVLRQMSMIGDAIAHAVLPGIVIAFFLSGELSSIPVLVGATVLGILCTFLIETFEKKGNVQSDAAIGMTFTFLFAIGVILIAKNAGNLHLDQDCVLHGELAFVPLDTWQWGDLDMGPRALWILLPVFLGILAFILLGYRGLFLTTFDIDYARAIGISTVFWHYSLMAAVSMATVVSFESVGAILVVAFLILPGATAYLITDNLKVMLWLSVLVGVVSSILGYYLGVAIDGSLAGSITTAMGGIFFFTFIGSPRYGLLAKWRRKKSIAVH